MTGRVALAKRLERAIRGGHPWIFRDAIAGTPRLPDGARVVVTGRDGRPVAQGFWDARSAIAVRVVAAPEEDAAAVIAARVRATLAARLAMIDRATTDTFRWIHGEADRIPGVHLDVYGRALALRYDGEGARAFYQALDLPGQLRDAAAAAGIAVAAIVERRLDRRRLERRRSRGGAGAGEEGTAILYPPGGAKAAGLAGEVEVREHGLRFGVDLRHGQKGGLFLDQRENRLHVRGLARGRRVLNLFGYTGGFSIYAAAGGAVETVTVDAAAPAIEAARRNFARNGLSIDAARFVAGDAFAFLEEAAAAGARFDLVISDPPSFASNRRALPGGLRAYERLHALCARVIAPGGTLCAASCSSHVDPATFLETVRAGVARAGGRFELVELRGAGPDHPVAPQFPEGNYLKFAVGVVYLGPS